MMEMLELFFNFQTMRGYGGKKDITVQKSFELLPKRKMNDNHTS